MLEHIAKGFASLGQGFASIGEGLLSIVSPASHTVTLNGKYTFRNGRLVRGDPDAFIRESEEMAKVYDDLADSIHELDTACVRSFRSSFFGDMSKRYRDQAKMIRSSANGMRQRRK